MDKVERFSFSLWDKKTIYVLEVEREFFQNPKYWEHLKRTFKQTKKRVLREDGGVKK